MCEGEKMSGVESESVPVIIGLERLHRRCIWKRRK